MEAMTRDKNRETQPIDRLANLLVEDILDASDEEILAEVREAGGDPDRDAVAMRALFERSIVVSNKARLAEARAAVAAIKQASKKSSPHVVDIATARQRLHNVLKNSNLPEPLTLAARKESELSDDDVRGLLADLEELGLLKNDDESTAS